MMHFFKYQHLFTSFLLIISIGIFQSCEEDIETPEDENNNNTSDYYIRYKEDGETKEFTHFFTGFSDGGTYWDDGELDMSMFREDMNFFVTLDFENVFFSTASFPIIAFDTNGSNRLPYVHFDYVTGATTEYGHNIIIDTTIPHLFRAEIHSFDNNVASGIFEGKVFDVDKNLIHITDGSFRVLVSNFK